MFEKFFVALVEKYVAPFAEVDRDQLSVAVREGNVVLHDVKLKKSAFDDLAMPLTVKEGRIGELRIDVTWKSLRLHPAKIHVKDVELVLSPLGIDASASVRSERQRQAEIEELLVDEQIRLMRSQGSKAPTLQEQAFVVRLVSSIMNVVDFSVTGVHVRYEDKLTDPSRTISAGIRISKVEFCSVSSFANVKAGDVKIVDSDSNLKSLNIQDFSVYWLSGGDSAPCNGSSNKASLDEFPVVSAFNLHVNTVLNRQSKSLKGCPRIDCHFMMEPEVDIKIDCGTMLDVSAVVDAAILHANRSRITRERPSSSIRGHCREWWMYSFSCVVDSLKQRKASYRKSSVLSIIRDGKKYRSCFQRFLMNDLEEEGLEEMRRLEKSLPLITVMALRGRIEEICEKELRMMSLKSKEANVTGPNVFRELLKGWRKNTDGSSSLMIAGVDLTVSEEELCDFCNAEDGTKFNDFEGDGAGDPSFSVRLHAGAIRMSLSDVKKLTGEDGAKDGIISTAIISDVSYSIVGKASEKIGACGVPVKMQLEISSVEVKDLVTAGTSFPVVLSQGRCFKGETRPFLGVVYEDRHDDCALLNIVMGKGLWIYSMQLARRISAHLSICWKVDMRAATGLISRMAAASVDQQRMLAQNLIRKAVETRSPLDMSFDINLPLIAVPQTCCPDSSAPSSTVLLHCGRVKVASSIGPSASGGGGGGEYDKYSIDWEDILVSTCSTRDKWEEKSEAPLLSLPRISWVVQMSVARLDLSLTQLKVEQTLCGARVFLRSSSLRQATAVWVQVNGRNATVAPAKLEEQEVSTMVSFAYGGFQMLEQGWETMRRRELGLLQDLYQDREQRIKAYAGWSRVEYRLEVDGLRCEVMEDERGKVNQPLVELGLDGLELAAQVNSLDASVRMKVSDLYIKDTMQKFGKDYLYILGSSVQDNSFLEGPSAAPVLFEGEGRMWHPISPSRQERDVEIRVNVGQVFLGGNLETMAELQNCLALGIEAGLKEVDGGEEKEEGRAGVQEDNTLLEHVVSGVVSTAAAIEAAETRRRRSLSLLLVSRVQAINVLMHMERDRKAFPIALLSLQRFYFENREDRTGRIDIQSSLEGVILRDLTPAGSRYERTVSFGVVGVEEAGGGAGGERSKLAQVEYIHYGSKNTAEARKGKLHVRVGELDAILVPRFLSELYGYVQQSSIFRSTSSALSVASSNSHRFRSRLDSGMMSHSYDMEILVEVKQLSVKLPESSNSENCMCVVIPGFKVGNEYKGGEETATADLRFLVSSYVEHQQKELLSFSSLIHFARRTNLSQLKDEDAIIRVSVSVSPIVLRLHQQAIAFLSRATIASIAEVKAAWSWHYHAGKARMKSKSLLEVEPISQALSRAMKDAAKEEEARQLSQERAKLHMLDLCLSVQLETLRLTVLSADDTKEVSELEVKGVGGQMRIWSDTAWMASVEAGDFSLRDVCPTSKNVFKDLVRPARGEAAVISFTYQESAEGDGEFDLTMTGLQVNVAAHPIMATMTTVFNAFDSKPTENSASGGQFESAEGKISAEQEARMMAKEGYSWWGDSKVEGRIRVGRSTVMALQDCTEVETSKIAVSFQVLGEYLADHNTERMRLEVQDFSLYSLIKEQAEEQYMVDKSKLYSLLTRDYNDGGKVQSSVKVSVRSVDVIVTYQDVKRCYTLVRNFAMAAEESGFAETTGYVYFSSGMDRDAEVAPVLPTADSTLSMEFDFLMDCFTVSIINDCMGWNVPFATVTAKNIQSKFSSYNDDSVKLTFLTTLDANYYNLLNTCFEPILEPWTFKLEASELPGRSSASVKLKSDARIELNLAEMHMRCLVQTVEGWMQDSKTWTADTVSQSSFSPYRLKNESGIPLTFWLGASLDPPADVQQQRELSSGGEEPFEFAHKRMHHSRQRDMSLEFHTLSIKFEGVDDVLTHVPVDVTGVHMLPLGPLRAVAEIHNDGGCKIIAIQSTVKVYNKTTLMVDACVMNVLGEGGGVSEGGGSILWRESFAGESHGCVPLALTSSKYMSIKPAGDEFGYCTPFPIPSEPVTGESVFIACKSLAGGSEEEGEEARARYFRVRLDAKRPIGGHEENMRIVISIHPAVRVSNLLPYPAEVALWAVPPGKPGVKVATRHVGEGQIEQLYCTDLKVPLRFTVFLSAFRHVNKPILVFDPAGAVVEKEIDLLDDESRVLKLGVDSSTSAWGDVTITVYAQYIFRNFTSLPLIYGSYRSGAKVAAGQSSSSGANSSSSSSPVAKSQSASSAVEYQAAFQGIYAVFGPRSGFQGNVVLCDPPMADGPIKNAEEIKGNIAVIRRGVIPFTEKARSAARAGAIAVIFINSDESTFLAEGDKGPGIRLPCVTLNKADGEALLELRGKGDKVQVMPEGPSRSHRTTSQELEWKRLVKAIVRVGEAGAVGSATPERRVVSTSEEQRKEKKSRKKEISFPDSWMEQPGDMPFMFSYDHQDLTGNKATFCVLGSDWSSSFSLENMGTTGVLEVPGKASDLPSLKGAKPMYEFGLSFELGTGHYSRSKICSIFPRYTVCNRIGYTIQLVQVGLEEEHNAVLEIKDGELFPFHWVDEKKTKACRARVVPEIGTHETYSTAWSGPIRPDQVGSFSIRFPPEKDGDSPLNVSIEIRLRKAAAFMVLRREKEDYPQYAVDNQTSKTVEYWQAIESVSSKLTVHKLAPGQRAPLCWDRPHEAHVISMKIEGVKESVSVKMNKFATFQLAGGIQAEVFADGPTRSLRVKDLLASSSVSCSASTKSEEDDVKYAFQVELSGVGVSVIDAKLDEIMYGALLDISTSYRVTRSDFEFEVKIDKVQVDNQTDRGPEILLGLEMGKGEGKPAIHVSMVRSRVYKNISFFKYFAFSLREMSLDLEETIIMRLLDAAQNVVDSSTISVSDEKPDDLRASGFKNLRFLEKEAIGGEKMYFELLQLHPIVVNLSFYGTGALMDRASTEGGGLSYNPMFAAMKALGVVVTNIDKAPICLNALVLERPFATSQELSSSIRKHYRTQLIQQLYKLVGSFEFLGNPVGLVNNLGTGVQDFFYEPAQGMMKSPAEFAKGMQKGSLSLFKNSTYGVFNAASKITSSMSKSLVQLSGDSDYAQKRQESQSQRQKAGSSNLAQARQDALNEMSEGFMGIFAKPMAGAREGGASGFFSGLGKGLLGAVVKPTAGLMDLTSKATEAVRDTTKDGEVLKRLRPPRVNVGDGVLRLYDARSAYGCNAMRVIHSGSWKNDRYIGFCVLDANEAALVTDKNICVHKFSSHEVAWELPIVAVKEVQVDGSKVLVLPQDGIQPVNDAGAKTAVTPMTCTDSRYAEYLGDVIRRAVSVAGIEFMHRKSKTANSEYML